MPSALRTQNQHSGYTQKTSCKILHTTNRTQNTPEVIFFPISNILTAPKGATQTRTVPRTAPKGKDGQHGLLQGIQNIWPPILYHNHNSTFATNSNTEKHSQQRRSTAYKRKSHTIHPTPSCHKKEIPNTVYLQNTEKSPTLLRKPITTPFQQTPLHPPPAASGKPQLHRYRLRVRRTTS